jgi:TRAP transporter TAXI family solute receptor
MAAAISKQSKKYNISVVATRNASYENLHRVNKNDFQLGWFDSGSLYNAYHGTGRFKEKFKVLGWMTAHSGFQIIVSLADTGIKRISDFRGEKVSVGNPGGPSERHAKVIFPAHGVGWNEFQPKYLTADETFGMMKDKLIDEFIFLMPFF